ncbi:MAG: gephyrin-like molybdotransferase Glp [Myxococcota bacterium]
MGEAQRLVLEATPVLAPETVAATEALGRVLAEPVRSDRTLPPADCSAMDGYAVRAADLAEARADAPVTLAVAFEVAAGGRAERDLAPGEAARIFTGAALPPGADAVVRQEDTERASDCVRVGLAARVGDHVRPAGEDVRAGDAVLQPGVRLRSAHLGMLSALGRSVVSVHQRPRVAIASGGDELVEPDRPVDGGRIVSSNSYTLAAQCRELGALPLYLGIARDHPEEIERHLRGGLRCEVLVSSAGVSVGDRDFVRGVLEKLGCRLIFWGVLMKPGFPLAFGRVDEDRGPLVFGLPGNPVSAMVTFEQFVRPALLKMMGHTNVFRPSIEAVLEEPLTKSAGRAHFVRVGLLRATQGGIRAIPTGNQSSGVLASMTRASGLLVFPAEATQLRAGSRVRVQVLDEDFFSEAESGL